MLSKPDNTAAPMPKIADCHPATKVAKWRSAIFGIGAAVLSGWLRITSVSAQSSRAGMGSTPYADALGTGVTFRVWAPNATSVAVRGPFNPGGWNNTSNFLVKEAGGLGIWSGDNTNARAG